MAAEDVVLQAQLPDALDDRRSPVTAGADSLDGHAFVHAMLLRPAQQQRSGAVGVCGEVDAALHAGPGQPARPRGHRLSCDAADAGAESLAAMQEVGQPEIVVPELGEPDEVMRAARAASHASSPVWAFTRS